MIANIAYDLLHTTLRNVVVGSLPGDNAKGIALIDVDSNRSLNYFGTSNSIHTPLLRVVVRAGSYAEGDGWSNTVRVCLDRHSVPDQALQIRLIGAPIYLGKTGANLYEFQLTFQAYLI